jgi:hypothetical protein
MMRILRPNNRLKYGNIHPVGPQNDLADEIVTPLRPASSSHFNSDNAIRQAVKNAPIRQPAPMAPAAPVMTEGFPITMTDFSGKIVVGGRVQLAIFQNSVRQRLIVINPDTAIEILYVMYKNTPHSRIPLIPGDLWEDNANQIPTDEIYVVANTTGHAYGAYEGVPAAI